MTTYIALLRGINVGGNAMVAMSDLRELFAGLRFTDVQTLLQSGNVVFRGPRRASAGLERALEAECEKRLGRRTALFVRTAEEWQAIVARNPFPAEAKSDPSHLLVMFLKHAAEPRQVKSLQAVITGPEIVRGKGQQVYIVYPAGIGRSRLTNALIDKALATRGTGRNWNTVQKLNALVTGHQ